MSKGMSYWERLRFREIVREEIEQYLKEVRDDE